RALARRRYDGTDALRRHHERGRPQDRGVAVAQESAAGSGRDGEDGASVDGCDRASRRACRGTERGGVAGGGHTMTTSTTTRHPLDMLTGDEITRAVEVLRDSGRLGESALFASIVLH